MHRAEEGQRFGGTMGMLVVVVFVKLFGLPLLLHSQE